MSGASKLSAPIVVTPGSLGKDLTEEELEELSDSPCNEMGKKIKKAYVQAGEAAFAHCRFRLRDPQVRKELQQLQSLCREELSKNDPDKYMLWERIGQVTDKWSIPRFTENILLNMPPIDDADCTRYLDRVLLVYAEMYGIYMINPPIYVMNHPNQNYLDLRIVNYDRPVNELLPLIEDAIKSARENKKKRKQQGRNISPPQRRRLDKVDFQLKVFDMATEGKTFREIARHLRKRESTVKSAYLIACHHIAGKKIDKKRKAFLFHFNAETHLRECPTCKKAEREEQFCPKALAYAGEDYKSQRELTGFNTIADRAPKQHEGIRRVTPDGARADENNLDHRFPKM